MPDKTYLQVRVTPRSARDEVMGWRDGVLQVRLRAPPVEGQANEALRRFLAGVLDIPRSDVEIAGGATGRTKRLRIAGMTEEELRSRLGS